MSTANAPTSSPALIRISRRLWQLALWAHPRELRRAHGPEMTLAFMDHCRHALAQKGHLGLLYVWLDELRDLALVVLRERLGIDPLRPRPPFPENRRWRSTDMLNSFVSDLRYASRSLLKRPAFTLVAVLILTLGIGANLAIFTVANGVLLRALPYPNPDELVLVWPQKTFSKEYVHYFEENATSYSAFAGLSGWSFSLTGDGEPAKVSGIKVTSQYFSVLGVDAVHGRVFTAEEFQTGQDAVAVLSEALWQSRYGGDPDILGREILLNGEPREVVGVLASEHRPPRYRGYELWIPMVIDPADAEDYRRSFYIEALARLAPQDLPQSPGGTIQSALSSARTEVRRLASELRQLHPTIISEEQEKTAGVDLLMEHVVGPVRPALLMLLGAVAFVLLIACANVANLMLVRTAGRQREMAIQSALGAGRARVIRQPLLESLLLAGTGGVLGLVLTGWTLRLLQGVLPGVMPRASEVTIDLRIVAVTAVLSLVAALAFGLVPAFRLSRADLRSALHDGAKSSAGRGRQRLNHALVVVEVAASVVLLVGAGLMLKSLSRLAAVDPGFRAEQVLTLQLTPSPSRYTRGAPQVELHRQIRERLAALPGVEEVGAIQILPLTDNQWRFPYLAEDHPVPAGTRPPLANFRVTTPGYFRTLGIPLLRGRLLTEADRTDAPGAGLLNETLARQLWGDEDPIGKEIHLFSADGPVFTVVGVVGDVRQWSIGEKAQPEIYRPLGQWPLSEMTLAVRMAGRETVTAPLVQEAIWSIDDDIPISNVATLHEVMSSTLRDSRFFTALLASFALLALVLGTVGLYGVISYAVSQRTPEIGIRMALGARRDHVLREVLGQGFQVALLGLVLGLGAAFALTRYLESLLFEVSTTDAVAFAAAAGVIGLAALCGTFLPAHRASAVDPIEALRYE